MIKSANILNRQEVEQLCQLYLDTRLTATEEAQLRYVLGKLPYRSELIDMTRAIMQAELAVATPKVTPTKKPRHAVWTRIAALAAAVALMVGVAVSIVRFYQPTQPKADITLSVDDDNIIMAFEGGRQLSPEESEKAVETAMRKAETLLAKAKRYEYEGECREQFIINQTNQSK